MAKKSPKPITLRSDSDRRVRQCERLARLFQLLRMITSSGNWDVTALSNELGCSIRTVYRLLQTLSLAGVPWYFDTHQKAYKVRPGFKISHLDASHNNEMAMSGEEIESVKARLIIDGERFAKSLDEFLKALSALRPE